MNINVRMEGGLGDHLAANRFVPAILDKYPDAKIKIFSDTEGNSRSLDLLLKAFGRFYCRGGEVIAERNNKSYVITHAFGTENYPSHINNQKPDILKKMRDCDIFYDLHIDGLHWLKHDYDWLRYYYHFPKPDILFSKAYYDYPYIMTHLYARPNSTHNLDKTYVISLLNKLSEINKIIVITEKEHISYYKDILNNKNIEINTTNNLIDIFNIASNCIGFIGMDSGIRYIPYHYSKPTFVLSKYCASYGEVLYSQLIRWLIFKPYVFPASMNIDILYKIFSNITIGQEYALFPEILDNIERYIIKR